MAEEIISSKRAMIDKVVKELLEKETIEKDRFEELMKEEGVV